MKKVYLLFITILCLLLTSCMKDTTQLAKDEFSKYFNGKDEVALTIESTIYLENITLNFDKLIDGDEFNDGLIIKPNMLIFSTSKINKMSNYTLNIYKSKLDGTDIELIFSKKGYKTHTWSYAANDIFYIEHYSNHALDAKSRLIDKYVVSTNTYENIASGKECDLSDYIPKKEQSRYNIEILENKSPHEHGKFIVTDTLTNKSHIIDDDFLKSTIYIESMKIFNYGPQGSKILNGHLMLIYGIGAGNGWNHPYLIFEYNFELNTIEYKLLAFPYDSVPIDIHYIA